MNLPMKAIVALAIALVSTSALAQVEIGLSEARMRELSVRVVEYKKLMTDAQGNESSVGCHGKSQRVQELELFSYEGADRPDGVWAIGTDTGAVYTMRDFKLGQKTVMIDFVVEETMRSTYYLPRAGLSQDKPFAAILIDAAHTEGDGRTLKHIPRTTYKIICQRIN